MAFPEMHWGGLVFPSLSLSGYSHFLRKVEEKKKFRRRHQKRVTIKIVSTTGSTPYTAPKFIFQMNFGIKVTKLSLSSQVPSVSWSAETNQEDKIMIKSYCAGGSVTMLKNFNLFNYHNPPRWLCSLFPHYRQQTQGLRRCNYSPL